MGIISFLNLPIVQLEKWPLAYTEGQNHKASLITRSIKSMSIQGRMLSEEKNKSNTS